MKNYYKKSIFIVFFGIFFLLINSCRQDQYVQNVDAFIGTGGHGHTFPGASLPFGMVQLSPDTREQGWDGCGGYHFSDNFVYGFSHTHLSGTGIADYSDILFLPFSGDLKVDSTGHWGSKFSHNSEIAEPGFYSVLLKDYNINVELAATKRCGIHRYTFNRNATNSILIDLKYRDKVLDSKLEIVSNTEIRGYRFSSGWANNQMLFFDIKFNRPFTNIEKLGTSIKSDSSELFHGEDLKFVFSFKLDEGEKLLAKVGISAVDENGATKNLEAEIPDWDFDKVKQNAAENWNTELSKISIITADENAKKKFYTALYHSFLAPNIYSDVDGRYRGRDMQIHNAQGFDYYTVFSLWDTYRAEHPLFTIIDQKRTADFINTFIMQYEQGGLLPVWELSANETNCMIGNHAIPVIADAIANGVSGFDKFKAFEAMKASALQNVEDLNYYKSMGYIPSDEIGSSVSKTLEYAFDDWCVARVAKILDKNDDYKYFLNRAQYYKNVFDSSTKKMRPKVNGGWKSPFDPKEVDFNFTEANSWQYSFYVPQDIENLIIMSGGDKGFSDNLDSLFSSSTQTTGREQSDITGLIGQYAHGNEPSHHIAYLYSYSGESWKTQAMAAKICRKMYSTNPDGLCGNEDCGQMSAWYVFSAMGFYPVQPALGIYVFGSPQFDVTAILLENGKQLIIKRRGSGDYIQNVKLDGKDYPFSFITFADIQKGGILEFMMDDKPNMDFGKAVENRPKSYIEPSLLPVPIIKNNKFVFYDSLNIEFEINAKNKIFYSLNDAAEMEYINPISIKDNAKISFEAKSGMLVSMTATAEFFKGQTGRSIVLESTYDNQYRAGGDSAIIDFIRGSNNFADGKWQGFDGQDLKATIIFDKVQNVNQLSAKFLQDINSWIWLPKYVEYYSSLDGKNFHKVGTVENLIDEKREGAILQEFTLKVNNEKAKYIKIFAKGLISCPPWHKGFPYQGKAWLFIDELKVD
ncbi:MAG: hypothetical protein AUJ98_01865 [Bacteroidetes bacterium CG2_30_33_31]|nr:MAG: hypothetical protein AUJ98_01865 [Bacteroidetes bacterium CG2_30_33_31]